MEPNEEIRAFDVLAELDLGGTAPETELVYDAVFSQLLAMHDSEDGDPAAFVEAYQSTEMMVKKTAEARKAANARMVALEKGWARAKSRVVPKLLSKLEKHGIRDPKNPLARKLQTLLGTCYRISRPEWTAKMFQGSANVRDAVATLVAEFIRSTFPDGKELEEALTDPLQREAAIEHLVHLGLIEMKPVLTPEGYERAKQLAVALVKDRGETTTWAVVTAPGFSVGTRFAASAAPRLSAMGREMLAKAQVLGITHEAEPTDVDLEELDQ